MATKGQFSRSIDQHMAEESVDYVDEFYFAALFDDEQLFPISDEKYAEELRFQEALMSSVLITQNNSSSYPECSRLIIKRVKKEIKTEKGESSSGKFCMICMDNKLSDEMFNVSSCSHSYCIECIAKYVGTKIQENISEMKCPELSCKGIIEPVNCRDIVPKEVFERWENALCESLILGSQKFYCPYKDCSAMLVDDGTDIVTASECPNCRRLFCAQCKVAWHVGLECKEFKSLGKDEKGKEDLMLMELAKNKKWRRCRKCKFYVEKRDGCSHITCRCGHNFCYGCGKDYSNTHVCPGT